MSSLPYVSSITVLTSTLLFLNISRRHSSQIHPVNSRGFSGIQLRSITTLAVAHSKHHA